MKLYREKKNKKSGAGATTNSKVWEHEIELDFLLDTFAADTSITNLHANQESLVRLIKTKFIEYSVNELE